MKIRNHIAHAGTLLTIAACLVVLSESAPAQQQFPFEGPFTPVIASPMYSGRWYFQAGVRYRNLNSFRFTGDAHHIRYEDPGVPPFGPDDLTVGGCGLFPYCPIPFGTGTGRTGTQAYPLNAPCPPVVEPGDPRVTGIWFYQNGRLDARNPGTAPGSTCEDPVLGPQDCTDGSNCWRDLPNFPAEFLGRFTVLQGGAGTCCDTTVTTRNTGSFTVQDPFSQASAPSSFSGTLRVTFQQVIDGNYDTIVDPISGNTSTSGEVQSRIFDFGGGVFSNLEFRENILTPDFEAGVQVADYFSLFSGFSFYRLGRSTTKTFVTQADFMRRAFTDTYSFASSDTGGWTSPFDSHNTIANGNAIQRYQIASDGILSGQYPTRTYYETLDASQPPENFQETISHRADLETYEFRLGARSWFPLYGMGSFGFSLGVLGNLISYRLFGAQSAVSLGPAIPGVVVENQVASEKNIQFKAGGFIGSDLELMVRPAWFVRGAVQYNLSDQLRSELLSVNTNFDPSGFNASLAGGFQF